MKKTIILSFVLGALAAVAVIFVAAPNTRKELVEKLSASGDFSQAKREVAAQALDPSSVEFRKLRGRKWLGDEIVCGEYNAKNAFGAYTGFPKFYFNPAQSAGPLSSRMIVEHPEVPEATALIDAACST